MSLAPLVRSLSLFALGLLSLSFSRPPSGAASLAPLLAPFGLFVFLWTFLKRVRYYQAARFKPDSLPEFDNFLFLFVTSRASSSDSDDSYVGTTHSAGPVSYGTV